MLPTIYYMFNRKHVYRQTKSFNQSAMVAVCSFYDCECCYTYVLLHDTHASSKWLLKVCYCVIAYLSLDMQILHNYTKSGSYAFIKITKHLSRGNI